MACATAPSSSPSRMLARAAACFPSASALVGRGGRLLHERQRANESARQTNSTDRKILYRALGLRAPQRVSGDLQLPHAVALDPKRIRHEGTWAAHCVIMQIVAL